MTKRDVIHMVLAILVATGIVVAVFMRNGPFAGTIVLGFVVFPVTLIAFPGMLGSKTNYFADHSYVDEPSDPVLLRWVAWGLLILPPVVIWLTPVLFRPR